MASSKEKAVGLKDAYVAGLLDSAGPEGAAEAGAGALQELAGKLGMEQGQTASKHYNLDRMEENRYNDGSPSMRITKGGVTKEVFPSSPSFQDQLRYPVTGFFGGRTNKVDDYQKVKMKDSGQINNLSRFHETGTYMDGDRFKTLGGYKAW